jgi:hypothetical protein
MKLTMKADGFSFIVDVVIVCCCFLAIFSSFILYIFRSWNNNNHHIVCKGREDEAKMKMKSKFDEENSISWRTHIKRKKIHSNLFLQSIMSLEKHFSSSRKNINRITAKNQVRFVLRNMIQQAVKTHWRIFHLRAIKRSLISDGFFLRCLCGWKASSETVVGRWKRKEKSNPSIITVDVRSVVIRVMSETQYRKKWS